MPLHQRPPDEDQFRGRFEATLPKMLERARRIQRVPLIPGHWFSAAASECAEMCVRGFFYGAISVGQAYVEALGCYLAETNHMRGSKDTRKLWRNLESEGKVSGAACEAAHAIMDDRNDYHHLNKQVETEYRALEARAEAVVNHIYDIESDVFDCSASDTPGVVAPSNPQYWPSGDKPGTAQAFIRSVW